MTEYRVGFKTGPWTGGIYKVIASTLQEAAKEGKQFYQAPPFTEPGTPIIIYVTGMTENNEFQAGTFDFETLEPV